MALSNSDKGVIVLIVGSFGFAFIFPMIFYVRSLLDHHMLTWQNFIHTHWIGVTGIIAIVAFFACAALCIYLTMLENKVSYKAS
jgi:hypothetical protein